MATEARQRQGALVGRTHELTELDRAVERLADGEAGVVQLIGEPGIGKSRLLGELARRADERGHLVLDGRAAEFEQYVPFGLIMDALNDYLRTLEPGRWELEHRERYAEHEGARREGVTGQILAKLAPLG